MLECPLLAKSSHKQGCARESALPPKADIGGARTVRTQKADIGCLLSPPKTDIAADGLIPRKDSRFLLAIRVGERVYRIIDAA